MIAGRAFDLLVVGGGIHGAAVARDAALRGLQVALIEAVDFAHGASSRSSRLVHGGLRYLRHGHFALVREALHERERLLRLCPHLCRPVPMLLPFFPETGVRRWQMRVGVWLYGMLAGRSTLPRAESLRPAAALAAFPGLRSRGLRSALRFFDGATQDARLVLANVAAAAAAGARCVNHCELLGLGRDGALRLRDRLAGHEFELRARHVVNATHARVDEVRARLGVGGAPLVRQTRGSHLVLAPRAGETALCAFLPDQRIQFVIPHPDGTLCGTTDVDGRIGDDEDGVPAADRDYLLGALGGLLDPAPGPADVRYGYSGWRSLPVARGPAGGVNREAFVVRERLPAGELHSIVGGKLTTHRALAERTVAAIFGLPGASPTRALPLPGGDGPREVQDPLWWRHGSEAAVVRACAARDPALLQPICPHRPFLGAELFDAVRRLGAVTFEDAMLRRLVHSQGPCLQPDCLRRAFELFARVRPARGDNVEGPETAISGLSAAVARTIGSALGG